MRIFLISFLIFIGSAQAVTHDDYVNDYFTETSEWLTSAERDAIIFSRIVTSDYRLGDGLRPLTVDEMAAIMATSSPVGLSSIADVTRANNEVRALYAINDEILKTEENIAQTLDPIALTSDGILANAPVDLKIDLDFVTKTLFGNKPDPIEPRFVETQSALSLDPEPWQIGDPRTSDSAEGTSFSTGTPAGIYDEKEKSITAAIEDIMEYLQDLNKKPLVVEFPCRQQFCHGLAIGETAPTIKSSQARSETPGELNESPSVENKEQFDFLKYYRPIINRIVTTDNKDFYEAIETQVAANLATSVRAKILRVIIGDLQNGVLFGTQSYIQDERNYRWDQILTHNYKHLQNLLHHVKLFERTLAPMYYLPDR